jgi:hypothetical protein
MKKNLVLSIIILMALFCSFAGAASASSSCDGCASKKVCSEVKAGGGCDDSPAARTQNLNTAPEGAEGAKAPAANPGAVKTEFSALTAAARANAKTVIIKIKGDKKLLEKLGAEFSTKFGIDNKKSADCQLINIASELWVKIAAGGEKEKIEYLESIGLNIEKSNK